MREALLLFTTALVLLLLPAAWGLGRMRANHALREEMRDLRAAFDTRVEAAVEQRWLTVKYQPLMATAGTDHWPFKGHCAHNMRLDVPCEKCAMGDSW